MKTLSNPRSEAKSTRGQEGVALVICLGLLAVMTLLAVSFSIAMRVERMASRNFADGIRAKLLVQTALVHAMGDIDAHMYPGVGKARVYPAWDVTTSLGTLDANIITPEALDLIPAATVFPSLGGGTLRSLAAAAIPKWHPAGGPRGRVSYIIVNTSGLIDANKASGSSASRLWSTNFAEIDISAAAEFSGSLDNFVQERTNDVRYETIDELAALNKEIIDPLVPGAPNLVSTFQTFSYDPGRDVVFLKIPIASVGSSWWGQIDTARPPLHMGGRDAYLYLTNKFNINSITNFACWNNSPLPNKYTSDAAFMSQYFAPLTNLVALALPKAKGQRPTDIAWNIVNYLDKDRIPQGDATAYPWTKSEGGEGIPLVNEIVISQTNIDINSKFYTGTNGPGYMVKAEVWYPFGPEDVTATNFFSVQVLIYTTYPALVNPQAIDDPPYISTKHTATVPIPAMRSGDASAFFVATNAWPITFANPGTNTYAAIGGPNAFWFLIRVIKSEVANGPAQIVDEAMGYDDDPQEQLYNGNPLTPKRLPFKVTQTRDYSINDPRSNGQIKYWKTDLQGQGGNTWQNGKDYPENENTLWTTNVNCKPWEEGAVVGKGQGVPIYVRNNVMLNSGELGHIWQSNLDDKSAEATEQAGAFWRNIDLMRGDQGAMLLDMITTHPPRPPISGVFCINSRQIKAWATIFNNLKIGDSNIVPGRVNADYTGVLNELPPLLTTTSCVSFTDFLPINALGDQLRDAFLAAGAAGNNPMYSAYAPDLYNEDTFRNICELVSFRQNIFTIVLAAQAMSPDGQQVVGERRAIATVYRDAYSGRRFIRNFKWLDD